MSAVFNPPGRNSRLNKPLFSIACWALLLLLQYKLWFVQDGIITSWQLNTIMTAKQQENSRLLARNNRVAEEIKAWKSGSTMIEGHARYELGMVKNDEIFYRIVK